MGGWNCRGDKPGDKGVFSQRNSNTGLRQSDQRSLVYLQCPQNLILRFVHRRLDHRIKLPHRVIAHPPQDRIQGPRSLMLFLLFVQIEQKSTKLLDTSSEEGDGVMIIKTMMNAKFNVRGGGVTCVKDRSGHDP